MEIIKGGTYNGIEFSCMYDAHNIVFYYSKEKDKKLLYGMNGFAPSLNDAPSIVWFDENMTFAEGELLRKCVNCKHVGKSGGGFFAECLCHGFQINNEIEESCEDIELLGYEDILAQKIEKMKNVIQKHYKNLQQIPKPESYSVGGTYYGSTELHSSVGNHLEIIEGNYTKYGYGSNIHYKNIYAIRIGEAYKYPKQEIADELMKIFDGKRYDSQSKMGIIIDYGTNYSVVGFGTIFH